MIAQSYKLLARLHRRRDELAAEAINKTLQDNEIGLLFFGGTHNILPLLHPDIKREILDNRLLGIHRELDEARRRRGEGHQNRGKEAKV